MGKRQQRISRIIETLAKTKVAAEERSLEPGGACANSSASYFRRGTGRFSSIRAWQVRFVDLHPTDPTAPVAVGGRFTWRYIVEGARGNNGSLAVARGMRNRTVAVAANLSREAFRLRKVEAFD